jgi:hypothetical protein
MAVGLHVADHWLDRRAAPELAHDDAVDAALLPRDEDPSPITVTCHRNPKLVRARPSGLNTS